MNKTGARVRVCAWCVCSVCATPPIVHTLCPDRCQTETEWDWVWVGPHCLRTAEEDRQDWAGPAGLNCWNWWWGSRGVGVAVLWDAEAHHIKVKYPLNESENGNPCFYSTIFQHCPNISSHKTKWLKLSLMAPNYQSFIPAWNDWSSWYGTR